MHLRGFGQLERLGPADGHQVGETKHERANDRGVVTHGTHALQIQLSLTLVELQREEVYVSSVVEIHLASVKQKAHVCRPAERADNVHDPAHARARGHAVANRPLHLSADIRKAETVAVD